MAFLKFGDDESVKEIDVSEEKEIDTDYPCCFCGNILKRKGKTYICKKCGFSGFLITEQQNKTDDKADN